ncbi:MAG: hypothetical protein US53_C0007G0016 [Candidatus Woesebacteria bacterium GW2011_GWA1_37_7]|uniref:UPF0102 protein US53_C0007G0016 n=1 Tax=Candidatus Woesebacteria bacterium GW2011_GWA1_37_7 TaxID=1618545 RepID=A0A0G0H6V3_9BACT|nr:MAG: hypothetical protein US53_C0007G0016 [Candidatus Woesebacteria bacterium GW2011_GWA1_37_7]
MLTKVGIGRAGEDYSVKFLKKQGYKILSRNFRTSIGEIDIIAFDKDTLVFVEVKMRSTIKYGFPEEAVTTRKLRTIKRVADVFIKKHKYGKVKYRIDVMSILINNRNIVRTKLIKMY